MSGGFQQSDKKTFLDTYAHIAASNNKRCPKRLRELAKPKKQFNQNDRNDYAASFDLNYYRGASKSYGNDVNRNLKSKK